MNIIDIINKKRMKQSLNYDEISYAVNGYVEGSIPDYQMSALLMAIVLNGMTDEEIFSLTDVMIESGDTIDLGSLAENAVDKHSTGGIGDKTTLILAPLVAACGVKVAKMSGRGLGHTGGTIDKLESIPGFKAEMDSESVLKQIEKINIALVNQTGNLVPADKKIYALRNVTATIASMPLIASSIMSKKIASSAHNIVIDVKVGNGALVQNIDDARYLSELMIKIGKKYQRKVVCVITEMDRPLGRAIGNSLEVMEAINVLRGKGPHDVNELIVLLASHMVSLGNNIKFEKAETLVKQKLEDGSALKKFFELVAAQCGNLNQLKMGEKVFSIKSRETGFVKEIDALKLGKLACLIGACRTTDEDVIDHQVGFILSKQVGDYVLKDEELIRVYLNNKDLAVDEVLDCFTIANQVGEISPLIKEIIE